jgi:hypothetical protein
VRSYFSMLLVMPLSGSFQDNGETSWLRLQASRGAITSVAKRRVCQVYINGRSDNLSHCPHVMLVHAGNAENDCHSCSQECRQQKRRELGDDEKHPELWSIPVFHSGTTDDALWRGNATQCPARG